MLRKNVGSGLLLSIACIGLLLAPAKSLLAQQALDPGDTITLMENCCPMSSLDPAHPLNQSGLRQAPMFLIYDRLIHVTPDGKLTGGLAVAWKFLDGETKRFEMTLRTGVKFHDGAPLNAIAVAANFERQLALGAKASKAVQSLTKILTKIEAVDSRTVRLTLSKGLGSLPFMLALQPGMMVSPNALDSADVGGGEPIGAGGFKVLEWKPKQSMVVTRFEDYWDKSGNRPGAFDVRFVRNSEARLNAVRSGQANIAIIEPRQMADAKNAGLDVNSVSSQDMWTIYMKTKSGPLGDVRVRRAIMHGLDRDLVANDILFGAAAPTQQIFSAGHAEHLPSMAVHYPYDPERAKELLAEAGYKDGLSISMQVANIPERVRIAETVVALLSGSGFNIDLRVRDINQYVLFSQGTDDMLMGGGGSRADALGTIDVLVGSVSAFTPDGTVSEFFDQKLEEARVLSGQDPRRHVILQELNREIVDKVAWAVVAVRNDTFASKSGCIAGFESRVAETQMWGRLTIVDGCK